MLINMDEMTVEQANMFDEAVQAWANTFDKMMEMSSFWWEQGIDNVGSKYYQILKKNGERRKYPKYLFDFNDAVKQYEMAQRGDEPPF